MQQPLMEYRDGFAGRNTRVLEIEGDGPPVLLLHGFADSADTWRIVLDRLGRQGRKAMAIDLPGFGTCTDISRDRPVLSQIDEVTASAIRRLSDETGEPVIVAGNSMGGCAALRAGQNPALPILAISPVAPAGFDMPSWFSVIEREPLLKLYFSTQAPIPERVVRAIVAQLYRTLAFADPRGVDPAVVRLFTSHLVDRASTARIMDVGQRILPEFKDSVALETITAPVFLVWGNRDRMVTHKGSRHILEALPETQYDLISGCGHCPQIEAPDRVVDAIERAAAGLSVTARTNTRRRQDYR